MIASRFRRLAARTAAVVVAVAAFGLTGAAQASAAPITSVPTASWAPWMSCGPGTTGNCAQVRAITRTSDGTTWLGGLFTEVRSPDGRRSVPRQNLAALLPDGTVAPAVAGHQFNGTVFALASDGPTVYAGGGFSTVDGRGALHLARFDAATGVQKRFASQVRGTVHALALRGGRLYVGGSFTAVQGQARANLAAVDAGTGALDPAWRPTTALTTVEGTLNDHAHNNLPVRALALAPDGGRVYVGGDFDLLNGAARPAVGAVHPLTGATDTTFTARDVSRDQQTFQIAPVDGTGGRTPGVVVATGGYYNRGYTLTTDGRTAWMVQVDGDVQAAAVIDDVVYLGGHFSAQRMHVAAYPYASPTTPAPLPTWTPRLGPGWSPYFYGVWTLQAYGRELHAGGVFNSVVTDGVTYAQPKYARFNVATAPAPEPTPTPTAPEPTPTPSEPTPTPTPTGGAVFSDDFTNGFTGWDSVGGGFTAAGGTATGVTPGKIAVAAKDLGTPRTTLDTTTRLRVRSADPTHKVVLHRLQREGSPSSVLALFLRPDGTLGYRNESAGTDRLSALRIDDDAWHTVRLRVSIDGTTSTVATWLDGAPVPALTRTESLGTTGITRAQLGDSAGGRTYTIDYDSTTITDR